MHTTVDTRTPSEICRAAGLQSLQELVDLTGQHRQTLMRWSREKPDLFRIVVQGAAAESKGLIFVNTN